MGDPLEEFLRWHAQQHRRRRLWVTFDHVFLIVSFACVLLLGVAVWNRWL